MTTRFLLDASVVIPLVMTEHAAHTRAEAWAGRNSSLALCPISEGALTRMLVYAGDTQGGWQRLLRDLYRSGRYEFWPDDLSYADADLGAVLGHRQVTDAYLVALTRRHQGAKLATMDVALAAQHPDVVELVP